MATKLFLDTEFTGLHQNTTLISIGIVSENGHRFYGVFTDYDQKQINDWIRDNVIGNIHFTGQIFGPCRYSEEFCKIIGHSEQIKRWLEKWLSQFEEVEIWSDCLAYDWVLFCNLFGGALNIPKSVYYIPFDIATLFKERGIDPDISREEFAGISGKKHNALDDAVIIKACYEKLVGMHSVTMSENDYYCKDELYCGFYKCPKCGSTYVMKKFNFCPDCGIRLVWSDRTWK